jgi:hypothetical protein
MPVSFSRSLTAGILAGVASAIINNLYRVLYSMLYGSAVAGDVVHIASVSGASIMTSIIGGLVYFLLHKFAPNKAAKVFKVIVVVVVLLSLSGPLSAELPDGRPTPPGFPGLTIPMHVIAGLVALAIIPWWSNRREHSQG